MRPIDALVDATNYTMLETGQPLHAFDYDVLRKRANGKPTIITRRAEEGEKLTTLDEHQLTLTSETELVTDTAGPLSLAGVMGGQESGISAESTQVLLESATWNFINIRKTSSRYRINSEASYRFSRDVHPALTEQALSLCLRRMQEWAGGEVVEGVIDQYPLKREDPVNTLTETDIERSLGVRVDIKEAKAILERLGFSCKLEDEVLTAKAPANRTDIETGLVGKANLIEEVSRIYGFERIPTRRLTGGNCHRKWALSKLNLRSRCATSWFRWACRTRSPIARLRSNERQSFCLIARRMRRFVMSNSPIRSRLSER